MSSSWASHGPAVPVPASSTSDSKSKKPASRQLLSCTKCRERKVKCDRTKPCSACCARGHPKDCDFVVGEGNEYGPIPQSYEIRKLRQENQRLRERLQAAQLNHSADEEDEDAAGGGRNQRAAGQAAVARQQRRFKTSDRIDNLYFGTPGLATILDELSSLQIMGGTQSLTHPMPKGKDVYAPDPTSYPFPVVLQFNDFTRLVGLLPPRDELFRYLDAFQERGLSCSFPHTPDEVTKGEVERFLADAEENAKRYPDMLALIFATLATGSQMGEFDRSGGQWNKEEITAHRTTSDAFITLSMQALREASFMSRPTLLGIQALIMMGPYLTNSGRFLDAWTLFGTTIRLAHSIGLHRHPSFLDPTPSLRECQVRQTLWWWMLHMDQQYSITLGRPLGISGIGDCPRPEMPTTDVTRLRLNRFIDEFTILARQILGSNEMTSVQRIDEFTDKLMGLWDTMPESLQFNESWAQKDSRLPEWPLDALAASLFAKVQSLLILLNRQRLDTTNHGHSPELNAHNQYSHQADPNRHHAPVRGRHLVVNSSVSILQSFMFFYHRNKAALICWTMSQQAFNAAMILLLDAWEMNPDLSYDRNNLWMVEQAFVVFVELNKSGVHRLAKLAEEKIFAALEQIRRRNEDRASSTRDVMMQQQHSQQQHQIPQQHGFSPDTAPMLPEDTVMGSTGMYLLESPGLQFTSDQYPGFRPWGWDSMVPDITTSTTNPSAFDLPTTTAALMAHQQAEASLSAFTSIPVSQITAAPFPVMSTAPMTMFDLGLQPRMPASRRTTTGGSYVWQGGGGETEVMTRQSAFGPVDEGAAQLQMHHAQHVQQQQQQQQRQMSYDEYQHQQLQQQQQQQQHPYPSTSTSRQQHQQHQQQQSFSRLRGLRHTHHLSPLSSAQQQQQAALGSGIASGRPRAEVGRTVARQRRSGSGR